MKHNVCKKISLILAIKYSKEYETIIKKAVMSVMKQNYSCFELLIITSDTSKIEKLLLPYANDNRITLIGCKEEFSIDECWRLGISNSIGDYVGIVFQEAYFERQTLTIIAEAINAFPDASVLSVCDDVVFNGKRQFVDDKKDIYLGHISREALLGFSVFPRCCVVEAVYNSSSWIKTLKKSEIVVINECLYHVIPIVDLWKRKESVRCVAFYLPQFHAINENDKWWGKGFTEWTNVRKAEPLYEGHNQPRIPDDCFGYYDLGDDHGVEIQNKQMLVARQHGIFGFCYYYYWFGEGKRLLEKPLDRHLNTVSLNFPFCLCWANENWTRSWDGNNKDVLMQQTYCYNWEKLFVDSILPYLKDERYIRVNGAPYLLIYDIEHIKKPYDSIKRIREYAFANGISRIHISAVRRKISMDESFLSRFGLDSFTDFPPHMLNEVGVDVDNNSCTLRQLKDYRKACDYHSSIASQSYVYFRTAMLEWDNTPRRGVEGTVYDNFSFDSYKKWLYAIKRYTIRCNSVNNLLFINAWNEWGEGTYLEPDKKCGYSALEYTKEILMLT